MRIKNLLLLAAFLATSGGAMAQEAAATLTAKNAKVVPGYQTQGDAEISFVVPATIGGWQMELVLPEGISLESQAGKLKIGTDEADGANVFPGVTASPLHKNHQLIGGTNTDGNVLLVCVPTAKEEAINAKSGKLCSIKLKADKTFTGTGKVEIKGFVASDPQGSATQYKASDIAFNIIALLGDIDGDGEVTVYDVQKVINMIVGSEAIDDKADLEKDSSIDVYDVQKVINEIVL